MAERLDVETRGCRLNVDVRPGDGATVFLHGFGGDLRTWDACWDRLPVGRRYTRYDLRGFGESRAQGDAVFHHADDLADLLDALEIARCDLVGLSMGGSVAINFALGRPDRVRSLGLISPGLTAWDWSDEWQREWRPMVDAARAGDMAKARSLWFGHALFETTRQSDAVGLLEDEIARFAGKQWAHDRQAPALPDLDRLHELAMPVLLLTGARDLPDFRLIADLVEGSAGNVTRHDHERGGHLLHIEDPAWCCDRLTEFWRERGF